MCTDVYALPAGERKARYAALAQDIDGLQGGRPVDANAVKQWMWQQASRIKKQGQGVRKGAGEDVLAGLPMFGTPPPPTPAPTQPETVGELKGHVTHPQLPNAPVLPVIQWFWQVYIVYWNSYAV